MRTFTVFLVFKDSQSEAQEITLMIGWNCQESKGRKVRGAPR
jgi:hypothetical protein